MSSYGSPNEPDRLDRLLDRVEELVAEDVATLRELTAFLQKPYPRIHEWVVQRKVVPNGRITLKIQEWVYLKSDEILPPY